MDAPQQQQNQQQNPQDQQEQNQQDQQNQHQVDPARVAPGSPGTPGTPGSPGVPAPVAPNPAPVAPGSPGTPGYGWRGKITSGMWGQLALMCFYLLTGFIELRQYQSYEADESNQGFFKSKDESLRCEGLVWYREETGGLFLVYVSIVSSVAFTILVAFPLYYGTYEDDNLGLLTVKDGRPYKFSKNYTLFACFLSTYMGLRELRCGYESIVVSGWTIAFIIFFFLAVVFAVISIAIFLCYWGRPVVGGNYTATVWLIISLGSLVNFIGKLWTTFKNFTFIFDFTYTLPAIVGVVSWIDTIVSICLDVWIWWKF